MALNLGSQGGDFLPYAKFNGKAGRWYVKKDETEQEVINPTFVADFDNIKTGWFLFMEGQAPNIVFDPNLQTPAPKPGDNHKRGFRLELFSQQQFGGLVELQGASMHLCSAINDLYAIYEKDCEFAENKGKLPVIQCTGSTPMKDKMGTNYRPIFSIMKWVDRPDAMGGTAKVETAAQSPVADAHPVTTQPASNAASEF